MENREEGRLTWWMTQSDARKRQIKIAMKP